MRKITKQISLILLLTILLVSVCKPVNATVSYGIEIISDATTVEKGTEFEITIKVKDIVGIEDGVAGLSAKIEYDTTKLEKVGEGEAKNGFLLIEGETIELAKATGVKEDTELAKFTFKAIETGETEIKLSGIEVADGTEMYPLGEDVTKPITITEVTTPDPTPDPTPELSSNSNLASISIDGAPITNFNKETLEYTLTAVENTIASIEIKANTEDTKATVEGTGTKELAVGNNTFEIKVTAEDGTTKIYKINVERKAAANPDPKPEGETADKNYNNAGTGSFLTIVAVIAIVTIVLYRKNKEYKGI